MSDFDLLSAVQPSEGWTAVVGIKGVDSVKQVLVETREEVDDVTKQLVAQKWNVFFGVAKFKDDSSRTKTNVLSVKSLWMDIDCGPDKAALNEKTGRPDGYANQRDALTALKEFVTTIGLPKPIVVNSGRGLHVYWPLEKAVRREEWEPVARKLRDLCFTHQLYADPACFEAARVLRIPGTFNFKGDDPVEVKVLSTGEPNDLGLFRDLLGVKETVMIGGNTTELSPLAKMLRDNIESSFAKIMRRGEEGCAQLNDCFRNRETLSEPRWFSALSIAKFCKDKDSAIHKLSADHPDYDPERTEHKLSHILGPHKCATFEAQNPGGCKGCPHKNKIKSPIALGRELREATAEDNVVVETTEHQGEEARKFRIPEYPWPFARGKNGGVYRRPSDDEEAEPRLVCEDDIYIVRRMEDPNPKIGEVAMVRIHTPKDGVREFIIPNETITADKAELLKTLARKGISIYLRKQADDLIQYMVSSFKEMRQSKGVEKMRSQFGWTEKYSKFILGDREITPEGTFYSPPSSLTEDFVDKFEPKGTFEKWKEVFNLYGRPGMEPHAFAAGIAFGAPLFHMSGHNGAILNLINSDSGTGKTTILHMCNSVWGDPEGLCSIQADTHNSKVHKIGVFNSIPTTFDEMTNTAAKQLSDLAYMMSQGKGKDRMDGASNTLRKNVTSWRTLALCSSNASFYEKLQGLKGTPQGESMRIIEYNIDFAAPGTEMDLSFAKNMFDHQLKENYGHAGEIYIRYVIANYEEVKQMFLRTRDIIDKKLKLTQRERFWSSVCASVLTGIDVAKRLGLHDWDVPAITKWMLKMITNLRNEVIAPLDTDLNVLGDFINRHMQHMLIVNDGADRRSNMIEVPLLEPRLDTKLRYEPDTKKLFIVARAFKTDCVEQQINYKATLDKLKKRGVFLESGAKRIAKGTRISAPPVQVLVFDGGHSEFFDVSELAKSAESSANESSGS